uniref:Uncharacterized protein n=1 Tax=Anguilla anguilla TaxID=7936 RepID=A0A0E9U6I7_ANGAN
MKITRAQKITALLIHIMQRNGR